MNMITEADQQGYTIGELEQKVHKNLKLPEATRMKMEDRLEAALDIIGLLDVVVFEYLGVEPLDIKEENAYYGAS